MFGRKKREMPQDFNFGCSHPTLIKGKMKGSLSDPDASLYVCPNCGFVHIAAPAVIFKDNPHAIIYFQKLQKEIRLPKL